MRMPAALFECDNCDGWHLATGARASLYQVHHLATRVPGLIICSGCGSTRPLYREGEALPVALGRWPDLPSGLAVREMDLLGGWEVLA